MPDTIVLCGGVEPVAKLKGALLRISTGAQVPGTHRIRLSLSDISDAMIRNMPDRLADLLEIAAYVYCADQAVRRDTELMQEMGARWHRSFRFHMPVRDLGFWQQPDVAQALVELLTHLSEDSYSFHFVQSRAEGGLQRYLGLYAGDKPSGFQPDCVALFSGGLDSFAGAAETLLGDGQTMALVSHQSAPLVQARQAELVDALRQVTRSNQLFHVGVTVNNAGQEAREFSQRTRSFLFASLAFVVARLFWREAITFFENGVVSMNLPLAEHVLGARATRTTHPATLAGMGQLFSLVAENAFSVGNPYMWLTKAEIVGRIEAVGLGEQIPHTFSCAHVRDAAQSGGLHCGRCSQCIDRRFGILAAGLAGREAASSYALDILAGAREPGHDTVMALSFVRTALQFAGMTPAGFVSRFGQVFRALPHLDGTPGEAVLRLHDLHARHGRAVVGVLDAEFSRLGLAGQQTLPDTSLLSLVQTQTVQQPIVFADIAETLPPAREQAEASTQPALSRPIVLALDRSQQRVVFAGGAILYGRLFEVIDKLHEQSVADREENRAPADWRRMKAADLARVLGLDQAGMRQMVGRVRKVLKQQFADRLGVELATDDIIQNEGRKGYRLNPYLAEQPLAVVTEMNAAVAPAEPDAERDSHAA